MLAVKSHYWLIMDHQLVCTQLNLKFQNAELMNILIAENELYGTFCRIISRMNIFAVRSPMTSTLENKIDNEPSPEVKMVHRYCFDFDCRSDG